ncbi:MAG TPA: NAD(P)-dependent oxidoreductase [Steroidobacteraceae bacterium]|nr:NAD(P)-dependent oxidoreductase [Steroidobacteraceae bacterium]
MTLLVTGATGFVMSVLARHWLASEPGARVVILDAAAMDTAATRYFAPVADRLSIIVADITQPQSWREALAQHNITHVVHGATITPISRGTVQEARKEPEADAPGRIVEVNLMGTVVLLDWARTVPGLQRFIYVSSGAVYKHHGPDRPGEPLPEDGYVMPRTLYGVSKMASELITERYGELFGFSTTSVRLASVYGTMDRPTASRTFRHGPNKIAHMAVAGVKRLRVNTLEAVGDYIHAEDVARAIVALLRLERVRYSAYNIAMGQTTRLGELVKWAAEKYPGFDAQITLDEEADIVQDPTRVDGMWGAYDISRISAETGWRPRSVREAFHAYMDWIAKEGDPGAPQ